MQLLRKIFWIAIFTITAMFLLLVGLGFQGDVPVSLPPGVAGHQAVVDHIKLRVVESGHGPRAVILLHGMLGSAEDWETVTPLLAARYRVLAVDRPGHGNSEAPREVNDVALNARVVQHLMTAFDLKEVVVAGHSYGGTVALQLAVAPPPGLKGVVLVAPATNLAYTPDPLQRLIAAPLVGRGITRALIPLFGEQRIRDGLADSVAPDAASLPKDFFDQRVALWKKPGPLRAYAEHGLSYHDDIHRLWPEAGNIHLPVVILQGEADAFVALRTGASDLARAIPGASLRSFPDTGHYVQYRHPQAVVEAVDQAFGVPVRGVRPAVRVPNNAK